MHNSFSLLKSGVLVLALFFSCSSFAQHQWQDSIKLALTSPTGLYAIVHNRNKLFFGESITLYGVLVGVNFNDKVRVFSGLYGFSNADEVLLLNSTRFNKDTITRVSNTANFSVGIEYTYKQLNRFSLTLPIMVGLGGLDYAYSYQGRELAYEGFLFVPIEIGSNAYYDFLDWLGLKAGVGYRMAIGNRESRRLSAPFYNLGIRFSPFKLYNKLSSPK
jgi:hypothetical protein